MNGIANSGQGGSLEAHTPAARATSDPRQDEFMLLEYECISKESTERLKELWSIEKFGLGGAAALAAWLLTHPCEAQISGGIAWWLPLVFVVICGVRFGAGMRHLDKLAPEHIMRIERHFLGPVGGYECYFRPLAGKEKWETWAFWVVWVAAGLAAAVLIAMAPDPAGRGAACKAAATPDATVANTAGTAFPAGQTATP
ncbi:hypothetical protein ACSFA0_23320 [Variovorax sp. LT1P1]|uniref:hypothetical protein n=1 Tax=Variovorax sp. LT1P1 TaxID=3443730 RepID=UPI003F46FA1C